MSRMSDAAKNRGKEIKQQARAAGKKGGTKVNKNYKANLCKHANAVGSCDDCNRVANAAAARTKRIEHRAKRVNKAKKKQKKGIINCAVIAILLLATPPGVLYGAYELLNWVI